MSEGAIIQKLVFRAFSGAESLSTLELIELNRAAALILTPHNEREASRCAYTASLLAEAEANQLHFLQAISHE